jgi:taurine dioxygenase
VVDGATGTVFADAVAALAALPDGLRRRIDGLEACHLWPTTLSDRQRRSEVGPDWPGSVHPIVLHHPRTGVEVLFVNEHQTDAVVGLPADEGEALLQVLFGVLYRPANVFEHRWAAGDLLVWDNIALQHARHDLTGAGTRTLRRVALATRDVSDLMPAGLLEAYQAAGA